MSKGRTQSERSIATRQALLQAARRLFEQRGFDAVAAEEIVAEARVTRGALYHHFEDGKPGLFREVVRTLMAEVHARLTAEGQRARTPLEALELGMNAFLQTCTEPGYRRILLLDGPAVLGWYEWRSLDLEYGLGLLRRALEAAVATGQVEVADVEMTTHLLAGALVDAALLLGQARDQRALRRRLKATLLRLLHGLRPPVRAS
jgi:AcrR family transcriptional regulator